MKIRVAHYVEDTEPVFAYSIGVWIASNWVLSNRSLADELIDRAYTAAGIVKGTLRYRESANVTSSPTWLYEVKIFHGSWKELE